MKNDSNKRKEIKEKELHNAKEEAVCQLAEEVYFTLQSEHEGRAALEIFDGYVDMMNLAESIKENGVLTPATVRKKEDGRYEMLSGHRIIYEKTRCF